MTIYTVISIVAINTEPLNHYIVGSYGSRGKAVDACVKDIFDRLDIRFDLSRAFAHDENHPEVKNFMTGNNDSGRFVVKDGMRQKLEDYLRDEIGSMGCYHIYDSDSGMWNFDIDANDFEA